MCQLARVDAGCCASRTVVFATAFESSLRRTSAKIAGTANSAIAPSAQNADWKPPVSAAGAEWPVCTSVVVWLAATLEAVHRVLRPGGRFGLELVADLPSWEEYRKRVSLQGWRAMGTIRGGEPTIE